MSAPVQELDSPPQHYAKCIPRVFKKIQIYIASAPMKKAPTDLHRDSPIYIGCLMLCYEGMENTTNEREIGQEHSYSLRIAQSTFLFPRLIRDTRTHCPRPLPHPMQGEGWCRQRSLCVQYPHPATARVLIGLRHFEGRSNDLVHSTQDASKVSKRAAS